MNELPRGTVTFLFTDIEGSTKLWQQFPDAMPAALARHHEILNSAIQAHNGYVFQIIGDGFHAAFTFAPDAANAALDIQHALCHEAWGETGPIRVRMALHSGHAQVSSAKFETGQYATGEYLVLARTARLLSAGHGGQILASETTAELIREQLSAQASLRDLGIHRVKDFSREQIFQLTAPDLLFDFPPLNTLESLPNNLPPQLTSFVGRERQVSEIKEILTTDDRPHTAEGNSVVGHPPSGAEFRSIVRLLTLTGPGGAGKTRLSLQVAAELSGQFAQGVWFVELAPLSDAELVPQVVATTFGLREPVGRTILELLQDYMRDKTLLIVLDNCEHLIEACARLADALLRAAPHLKILATSREALGIAGETTYAVPSLTLPDSHAQTADALLRFESVRLFVERARAAQPAFAITESNAAAVAEICRRLDGIPLALELAAARVRGLTVEQIAQRLDERFRLLTSGSRTALPHHQTLRATIEWSYALLSEAERALFQQLAVFSGGWTLEAAEQVCASSVAIIGAEGASKSRDQRIAQADVLELMLRLVDKSLIVVEENESAARYRFLDTIWYFALEKLNESGQVVCAQARNRQLEYFVAYVESIDETLRGAEQNRALAALDRDLDNLRAALKWSSESNQVDAELRLASGLWRYWRVRSYFNEGRHWLKDALSHREHASNDVLAKALLGAGSLAYYQSDFPRGRQVLEDSLALFRGLNDKRGIAYCLNLLSQGQVMTGALEDARIALEEALTLFRELGDTRGMNYSLFFLGTMQLAGGKMSEARAAFEECLSYFQSAGDKWWVGNTISQLGWIQNYQGETDKAMQMFREALEISTQFGDTRGTARALLYFGDAESSREAYAAARTNYNEALKLFHEVGDVFWMTVCIEALAHVAARQNNARQSAQLLGVGEKLHEQLRAPIMQPHRERHAWSANRARELLGAQDFGEAWKQGRALTMEQAIELAMREGLPTDTASG